MRLKQKLPVTYLLFTFNGRLSKGTFWLASLFYWCTFYVLYNLLLFAIAEGATFILYPLLFWIVIATSIKRLHDQGYSGYWLFTVLIPVLGPVWLFWRLGFKKGNYATNQYGSVPGLAPDYLKNDDGKEIPHLKTDERIIDDVTRLNPVLVAKIMRPASVEEVCEIVKNTTGAISVGGGRFSMGGQTASPHSLHIDMRGMNKVLEFSATDKLIKVQTGIRWCDIQQYIDEHHLSIKIMQTYANFTVGGALSVNAHGRYMGMGPVVLSVRSINVVLADGSLVHATRTENQEVFFGAIGGYNGIGIIVEAELELADNLAIKRIDKKMKVEEYAGYFFKTIRDNPQVVFHNGDIYPPKYKRLRAVSWIETTEKPTVKTRLMPLKESYPLERYFLWSFTETPLGKWRREFLIDPLMFRGKKIHWRNYEAGYDVAELEPRSRRDSTYVLLEYFVPVERFEEFEQAMAEIFIRFNVNVLNVSIRHAKADPGTYLAWAREEVFAFVVYYKQRTDPASKHAVAVWTRELADAVTAVNGAYYLPYQVHPTVQQFYKAYPNAQKLFDLKTKLDPDYKFRNIFWDTYYKPLKPQNNG
ncbi:FAD-binding protein [Mucilaginibacter paludis]|uniref:FAD linked oxidase domain protein n=1 Tax=Mucilaginibacter paludis DSM 18603 TaxID=714943 RepID=H1Y5Y0_9SPHI|nr:FAD-binding protein [Mucilaginibacter paludis]EHQ30402.1 FAD linked oxidase domain protein [Mucilaginibacter paludis DSM 18603]